MEIKHMVIHTILYIDHKRVIDHEKDNIRKERKADMKKVIISIIVIAAAIIGFVLYNHRGGDIIGVTSYPDKNKIIMNTARDNEFVSGQGTITVGEGEVIHLEYDQKAGSFDVAICMGKDDVIEAILSSESLDSSEIPVPEEMEHFETMTGIEGTGSLDFDVDPGDYTLIFYPHDSEGKVTVTTQK